ncbi:MAG TPA: TIGR04086 family membrane protein [Eubacteriales bacterium]|jgi:putative membrane protein (TIGR04086 family)|nr:TIGR04086 family membrane protein [Clostridia bacterium]HRR89836.1 TIGR04086 family membrane protein [Eubacteriales bacterium]HRU84147.1 TIGR04086 family membrane protein [Eubacteriales bacterium]
MRDNGFLKDLLDVLKSVLVAVIISLVLVLAFALIVKWAGIPENAIVIVNYVIKFLSVLLGTTAGISRKKNGAVKGAVSGALYIALAFLLFAALTGGFAEAKFSFIDLGCGIAAGALAGIFAVNVKKEKKAA